MLVGWMGGWKVDRWMSGWMDGWMDGWMSGWMDGWGGWMMDEGLFLSIYEHVISPS